MAETKPIPVRLDDALIARLDRIAERIGTNRSAVIRMLVSSWVDSFEETGHSALPADWERIMADLDGRATSAGSLQPAKLTKKKAGVALAREDQP